MIEALIAASYLEKINVSLEVIDLRVLRPLKIDKIIKSIAKTRHLMTIDLVGTFGIGAEILATIYTKGNINLKPPIRLGMAEKPTPSSRGLVKHYPNSEKIILTIGKA